MDTTYDDLIIGKLLGGTRDDHRRARASIERVHLVGTHRTLWDICLRYFSITGEPIDYARFRDLLHGSGLTQDRQLLLDQEFARLWHTDVTDAHFRWALHAIRDQRRDERFIQGLSESLRTMVGEGSRGRGYEDARAELTRALAEIDRVYEADTPQGDIREDWGDVLREYEDAKTTEGLTQRMVRTGFDPVDQRIIGLKPGENALVAGYSSHGKSTILQNIAWCATVEQAKNVLILTNENQYVPYRARIYNRHTHHRDVGVEGGLRMNDLKEGKLSGQDEIVWRRVVQDFGTNPDYGRLEVVQMPTSASVEWAIAQMESYGEEHPLDLVILDYIGRCGAITPRGQRRDELNDSLQVWASALVGFQRGRGIPGITGYQVSREKMREAQLTGRYGLDCLAETSEAERNAHIVMTTLRMEDVDNEVQLQLIKNRDGALMEPTPARADWATTYIGTGPGGWL